jgi:flavin-dependent dehydrogenase
VQPLTSTCDALVIGAGIAGATAALLLARRGWHTVLVEGRPHSQSKTCGHCLAASAWPWIDALELRAVVEEVSLGPLRELRVELEQTRHGSQRALSARLPGGAGERACVIDREALEQRLVAAGQAQGVLLIRPQRVIGIERDQASPTRSGRDWLWQVTLRESRSRAVSTLHSGLLVAADGVGSAVARTLGWALRRPGRAFGFSGDLPGEALAELPAGQIRMHLFEGGYLGLVRADDPVASEAGEAQRVHFAALVQGGAAQRHPAEVWGRIARRDPFVEAWLREKGTPQCVAAGPMPWRTSRRADVGVALVGDAAGFVEPFTGEGMAWALASAAALDAALDDAASSRRGESDRGNFCALAARQYERRWARAIEGAHRRCGWIGGVVARPTLLRAGLVVAPGLVNALAGRVAAGGGGPAGRCASLRRRLA